MSLQVMENQLPPDLASTMSFLSILTTDASQFSHSECLLGTISNVAFWGNLVVIAFSIALVALALPLKWCAFIAPCRRTP